MEYLDLEGIWWLPSDESVKVAGTLRFTDEDGIRLALVGSFKSLSEMGLEDSYPAVFGLADGKHVTLFNCSSSGERVTFPGYLKQELYASVGCLGAHIPTLDDWKFGKCRVSTTHLADWVRLSGFKIDPQMEDGNQLHELTLRYSYPEEVQAVLPDFTLTISFGFDLQIEPLRDVRLSQSVHVRFETKEELTFDAWLSSLVRPLQNFLTLGTLKANRIERFMLTRLAPKASLKKADEKSVEFFFPQPTNVALSAPVKTPFHMLFTLKDIREQFTEVIERWYKVSDELKSVCDLYFSLKYREPTYVENRFLPLVQAAESYHRRRRKNEVLELAEHERRISAILEGAPIEHREWLERRLGDYSNEPSFRRRIRELATENEEIIGPLIGSVRKFADDIVTNRNFLTHFDESLREQIAQGPDLYRLSETTSFIIESCLLGELGITGDALTALFKRNQQYAFAVRRAREAKEESPS